MADGVAALAQHHRAARGGPVAGFALELFVGPADALRKRRHTDRDHDLGLLEQRHVGAEEKAVGRHGAAAVRAFEHEFGVADQRERRVVIARVAVGNVTADGAAVAHLRVGDQLGGFCQQRHLGLQDGGIDQVVFHRHRSDDHGVAFFADATQLGNAVDVDQVLGLGKAQLHHRQQAVAAGQQLGVRPVLAQQGHGLTHALGGVVLETRWDHGVS